jgi:hypothetical protein
VPTDIQINDTFFIDGYVSLADDKGANFLLGTLSATDIDTRASNYFDNKGFINTPSAVASGDDNTLTSSSCEGTIGSEFVIIDDFKISAGGGKSERDKKFFNLKGNVVSFKNSLNYERKPSYSLTLEIKNGLLTRAKTITITIINLKEKTT